DGGVLTAIAEMLIGSADAQGDNALGASIDLGVLQGLASGRCTLGPRAALFGETPSRYVLEVAPDRLEDALRALLGVRHAVIGSVDDSGRLAVAGARLEVDVASLRSAWLGTLDW